MHQIDYFCPACKKDLSSPANLNKHLHICDKYQEWVKEYKPLYYTCEICLNTYATKDFYKNHDCK